MDPRTCGTCHPTHFREWSGSMHAYATRDPIFVAMNARGQRETNGALGDFCVRCHAPMAVLEGATTDGLNLVQLPDHLQGITCYFCHNVTQVEGTHNNPLQLAGDTTMRGGISDPLGNHAHGSAYSPLHDRNRIGSSELCGSCHDVVTPRGVHVERTFAEWRDSLFASTASGQQLACSGCHMRGRQGLAADVPGAPIRRLHSHVWPGVDVALTPFPETESQRLAVRGELDHTLLAELCIVDSASGAKAVVTLENVGAGHSWPSGAAQHRRAWVELTARDARGHVLFASGVVADGTALTTLAPESFWRLALRLLGDGDQEVHMLWDAARMQSEILPAPAMQSSAGPGGIDTHVTRIYDLPEIPARATLRVRLRPVGLDVVDDLIASGDLDPAIRGKIPTFDLGSTVLEWRAEDGRDCTPDMGTQRDRERPIVRGDRSGDRIEPQLPLSMMTRVFQGQSAR